LEIKLHGIQTFGVGLRPRGAAVGGFNFVTKNTAPNSGVEKTIKLYNNILLQETRKAKTFFTPQGKI
jgi:hypothetical protein